MAKFKGKYRIESTRLQNWDYGWNASYFITICTKDREHFFGKIEKDKMILSEIGKMAEKYWFEIPEHFPFVKLGEFVVMPDHIHGIIEIAKTGDGDNGDGDNGDDDNGDDDNGDDDNGDDDNGDDDNVDAQNFAHLPSPSQSQSPSQSPLPPSQKNKFGPQSKNLASIIRGYKIGVTINSRKIDENWGWQSRYYDRIIRDDNEYNRIKNYIINNPKNWN